MTRFWRNGFIRESSNGISHWVEGHWVERDDWAKDLASQEDIKTYHMILSELKANHNATSRYIEPNARCPLCGANVFFFQNDNGSKVFFDELGPPWPKHPCTDNPFTQSRINVGSEKIAVRDQSDAFRIGQFQKIVQQNPQDEFFQKYGSQPLHPWIILKKFLNNQSHLLAIEKLGEDKKKFLCLPTIPREANTGTIVFINNNTIEYYSTKKLSPRQLTIGERVRKDEFLERLLSK